MWAAEPVLSAPLSSSLIIDPRQGLIPAKHLKNIEDRWRDGPAGERVEQFGSGGIPKDRVRVSRFLTRTRSPEHWTRCSANWGSSCRSYKASATNAFSAFAGGVRTLRPVNTRSRDVALLVQNGGHKLAARGSNVCTSHHVCPT